MTWLVLLATVIGALLCSLNATSAGKHGHTV